MSKEFKKPGTLSVSQKLQIANLRTAIQALPADTAQEIRDAYYKVAEGLQTLHEVLEVADLVANPEGAGPLLDEHFIASEALEAFDKSVLGAIV